MPKKAAKTAKPKGKSKRFPVEAPPKKKRKKRAPVSVELAIPQPDKDNMKYLRFLAQERYARDLNNPSVRELNEQEPFAGISWNTFKNWADKDRWVERRRNFHQQIRDRAADKLTETLISSRKTQHDQMTTMIEHLVTSMLITPAKTKEGVAQALTKLFALQDDFRVKILEDATQLNLAKRSPTRPQGHPIKPVLSRQDAKVAAEAVLRARLEETRARIKAGPPDNEDG